MSHGEKERERRGKISIIFKAKGMVLNESPLPQKGGAKSALTRVVYSLIFLGHR